MGKRNVWVDCDTQNNIFNNYCSYKIDNAEISYGNKDAKIKTDGASDSVMHLVIVYTTSIQIHWSSSWFFTEFLCTLALRRSVHGSELWQPICTNSYRHSSMLDNPIYYVNLHKLSSSLCVRCGVCVSVCRSATFYSIPYLHGLTCMLQRV